MEAVRVQCQTKKNGAGEKLTYTNLPVSFHIRTRFIFFSLSDMLDIICRAPRKDNTTCLGSRKLTTIKKKKSEISAKDVKRTWIILVFYRGIIH